MFATTADWHDDVQLGCRLGLSLQEIALKECMAKKQKKGIAMAQSLPFFSLLPAPKQRRIEQYKDLPRVKSWLEEGKEVVALQGEWFRI